MKLKDALKDIFPTLNLPPVSYAKLIKSHRTYLKKTETFKIKILSNIIINPIKEILELKEFMTIIIVSHKKLEIEKEFKLFELVDSKIINK